MENNGKANPRFARDEIGWYVCPKCDYRQVTNYQDCLKCGYRAGEMESDHTPEASTNIGAQGDTNLTQPSAGEQPTSVEEQGTELTWNDRYQALKTSKDDVERMAYYINQLSPWNLVYPGTGLEALQKLIATKCAEERRQAKYEAVLLLQRRLCTGDAEHRALDDRIWHITENYKSELRGENNE